MKIHCLGNEYIEFDSMALRIADSLKIPGVKFVKADSLEGIKGDIIILDAVRGIDKVKIIEGIDKIKEFYPVSAHDFDIGTELKLRKAVGEIGKITIIGVPMEGNIEEIKEEVTKLIQNMWVYKSTNPIK